MKQKKRLRNQWRHFTCADLLNSDDEPDCMKLWKKSNIGGVQIAGKDYWAYVQSAGKAVCTV